MSDTPRRSETYAHLIDGQVERLLAEQQPDGAFQAKGAACSICAQNVMYPLALTFLRPGGPCEGGGKIARGPVRYLLPPGGAFVWPRPPFNAYDRDGKASTGGAFAAFEVPLEAARGAAQICVLVGST